MKFAVPGQTLDGALPLLEFFAVRGGRLEDLNALKFLVKRRSDGSTVVAETVVNVGITYPTASAGRLSKGRYFGTWVISSGQAVAIYDVTWSWKFAAADAWSTAVEPIELVASVKSTYAYASITDMRDEGVLSATYPDARVQGALWRASLAIERATGGHWFEPRAATYTLDGEGERALYLPAPIVGIASVKEDYEQDFDGADEMDADSYRIYARHLSERLVARPDDRFRPRLEMMGDVRGIDSTSEWLNGNQNVRVEGAFGFTDPSDLPAGRTPEQIALACRLLARAYLPQLTDASRVGPGAAREVSQEVTRDQSVTYAVPAAVQQTASGLTGDPEVDALLVAYKRLPVITSV